MRVRIRQLVAVAILLAASSCGDPLGPNEMNVYVLWAIDGKRGPFVYEGFGGATVTFLPDTMRVDRSGAGSWVETLQYSGGLETPRIETRTYSLQFSGPPIARKLTGVFCPEPVGGEGGCGGQERLSVTDRPGGFDVQARRGRLSFQRVGRERH